MQIKTLTIAAALALGTASTSFAYPPRSDHPEVGPAGGDEAAEVGDAAWSVDRLSELLKPAEKQHAKNRRLILDRREPRKSD